jgi:hypothetical protein
LYFFFYE